MKLSRSVKVKKGFDFFIAKLRIDRKGEPLGERARRTCIYMTRTKPISGTEKQH